MAATGLCTGFDLAPGICMDLNDHFLRHLVSARADVLAFCNWVEEGVDVHAYWKSQLSGWKGWTVAANTHGVDRGVRFSALAILPRWPDRGHGRPQAMRCSSSTRTPPAEPQDDGRPSRLLHSSPSHTAFRALRLAVRVGGARHAMRVPSGPVEEESACGLRGGLSRGHPDGGVRSCSGVRRRARMRRWKVEADAGRRPCLPSRVHRRHRPGPRRRWSSGASVTCARLVCIGGGAVMASLSILQRRHVESLQVHAT